MIAIDTNVFVYAFDASDPVKQAKARLFLASVIVNGEAAIVPWQVAVELLARFRRWEAAGKMSTDEVQERFNEFLNIWRVHLPSTQLFERYFHFRNRYSLSHWDGLLVAACENAEASTVFSEDMQDGADYDGVKIVNPFR